MVRGVHSFVVLCSSLEGEKNGRFGTGGRDIFFYWSVIQVGMRKKSEAPIEERGVTSFIGVCSSLVCVKRRWHRKRGEG